MRPTQPPQRTLEFDHPPTDDELRVFFPPRFHTDTPWWRERDGRSLLKVYGLPFHYAAVVMGFVVAGIVFYGERIGLRVDRNLRQAAAVFTPVIIIAFWAFSSWFNRNVAAMNPILAYDRLKGELAVEGRSEPISVGELTEILVWKLTGEDYRALKFAGDGEVNRQVSAVTHRDGRFALEFLFHDRAAIYLFGLVDPVDQLAQTLNLPKRSLAAGGTVKDLRQPDRFTKKF
jgi:hypothetical protein